MPLSRATIRIKSANRGWLWRKSAGMLRHVRLQRFSEELLRSHIAVLARGPLQPRRIIRRSAFLHAGKHLILAFGKMIEIVHQIDQQELRAQRLGKRRLHPKIELASAERKLPVALAIVDDGLVVKLRRANPEAVIDIGRGEKKA